MDVDGKGELNKFAYSNAEAIIRGCRGMQTNVVVNRSSATFYPPFIYSAVTNLKANPGKPTLVCDGKIKFAKLLARELTNGMTKACSTQQIKAMQHLVRIRPGI